MAALMTARACARFMPMTEGMRGAFGSMAVIVGRDRSTSLCHLEATRSPVGRVPGDTQADRGTEDQAGESVQELARSSAVVMSWMACCSAGFMLFPPSRWAAATLLATVSTKRR
jgi:hypothetical protein